MESRRCQGRRQEARAERAVQRGRPGRGPAPRIPHPAPRSRWVGATRFLPRDSLCLTRAHLSERGERNYPSSPRAAVRTGIFRGRIVLSRPDKPEEKSPLSASPGLPTHGKPPRRKYVKSIAFQLQALHLIYRKERSGTH